MRVRATLKTATDSGRYSIGGGRDHPPLVKTGQLDNRAFNMGGEIGRRLMVVEPVSAFVGWNQTADDEEPYDWEWPISSTEVMPRM